MSDHHSPRARAGVDRFELLDVDVPLPEIWTFHELDADGLRVAEAEVAEMLADKVDDPEAVAAASVEEFMERIGGGARPLLVASFREEMSDGSIFTGSLNVVKNDLGGSLDPWREAYADADDVEVMGESALRTFEQATVQLPGLFDEPLTVCTWRYLVPFDPRSILMFTFSSPNSELADDLVEYFDDIMANVQTASDVDA